MLYYISKSIFDSKRTCAYQMAESMQMRPHFSENGDQIYQTYIYNISFVYSDLLVLNDFIIGRDVSVDVFLSINMVAKNFSYVDY